MCFSNNYNLQTIFEICGKNKSQEYLTMKEKRAVHKDKIADHHQKVEKKKIEIESALTTHETNLQSSNQEDIQETFQKVVVPKKRKIDDLYKPKNKKQKVKDENYIPYAPKDQHTEEGYI